VGRLRHRPLPELAHPPLTAAGRGEPGKAHRVCARWVIPSIFRGCTA
jgi:hypothetical protein